MVSARFPVENILNLNGKIMLINNSKAVNFNPESICIVAELQ